MDKSRILFVGYCLLALATPTKGEFETDARMYGETSVAFAPDSSWVATGGGDAMVRIREIPDGKQRAALVGHDKLVTAVAVSPDGQSIASSSMDGTIRLWDVKTLAERAVWKIPEPDFPWGAALAYAPDGQMIAVGLTDGRLQLWDIATGKVKASWNASPKKVDVLVFAPDGRTIATTGRDRIVRLYDVRTHTLRFELAPLEKPFVNLAYARNGSLLAVGNGDSILLLDPKTGKEWSRLIDCPLLSHGLAFTRDDAFLITGAMRGVFVVSTGTVFDQDRPRMLRETRHPNLAALSISPNGERLAFCYLGFRDTGHASFEMMSLTPPERLGGVDAPARN